MIKSLSIVVVAFSAIVLAASCTAKPPNGSAPAAAPVSLAACATRAPGISPLPVPRPPTAGANTGTAFMTITTNLGTIEVEIDRAKTPCTAAFLGHLAKAEFYRSTACHRLTTEGIYVLQCGDPLGTGMGGPDFAYPEEGLSPLPSPSQSCSPGSLTVIDPSIIERLLSMTPIPAETIIVTKTPGDPSSFLGRDFCLGDGGPGRANMLYGRGIVAMANAGPDTTGSQFFFVYGDSTFAEGYTVFGRVRSGMEVVDKIVAGGTADGSTDGRPRERLVIEAVRVG